MNAAALTVVGVPGLPEIVAGSDLTHLISTLLPALTWPDGSTGMCDGDVVVVTSKVVSKAEGRVVAAESELALERGKRKEAELYLNRILKDMQNNAPVLAAQKRDFNRVLESHNHLTRRLDEVTVENGSLRDQLRVAVGKAAQAEEDTKALSQHNSDLSTQLQNLLKHSWDQQYGAIGR